MIVTVGSNESSNGQRLKQGHKAKILDPDATRAAYKGFNGWKHKRCRRTVTFLDIKRTPDSFMTGCGICRDVLDKRGGTPTVSQGVSHAEFGTESSAVMWRWRSAHVLRSSPWDSSLRGLREDD